jgi:hypothetical protein
VCSAASASPSEQLAYHAARILRSLHSHDGTKAQGSARCPNLRDGLVSKGFRRRIGEAMKGRADSLTLTWGWKVNFLERCLFARRSPCLGVWCLVPVQVPVG